MQNTPEKMKPPFSLITRADDFGASPGTNEAILACLDAGFIRNVGVMVPAPFLGHRLEELLGRQDSCCVGLHGTLTSEWAGLRWGPVLPGENVPSLLDADGNFFASTQSLHERALLPEMLAEIRAQLDLARRLGLFPRYLDLHMVFTWIPGVAEALAALCDEEGLVFANGPQFVGFGLAGESFFEPGAAARALEQTRLAHAGKHHVSFFHPAKRDAASEMFFPDRSRPSTAVAEARHREFELLSDAARMPSFLRDAGILPATYSAATPSREGEAAG